jgi:hypothetical protein
MNIINRFAALLIAALLVGAAPAGQLIPLSDNDADGEALVIPADSPVQFERLDNYGVAHFRGTFVLTGTFTYGCAIDCEERPKDRFYRMDFTPDAEIVERLPHWRVRNRVPSIVITNERAFVRSVGPGKYAEIHRGGMADIRGRASILVDHFEVGIECDSPTLNAHFVSIVEAPKLAANSPDGTPGCG